MKDDAYDRMLTQPAELVPPESENKSRFARFDNPSRDDSARTLPKPVAYGHFARRRSQSVQALPRGRCLAFRSGRNAQVGKSRNVIVTKATRIDVKTEK